MKLIMVIFTLFATSYVQKAYGGQFSVGPAQAAAYVSQCGQLLSDEEMRKEIPTLLQKVSFDPIVKSRSDENARLEKILKVLGFSRPPNPNPDVKLNGLNLKEIPANHLYAIGALTANQAALKSIWKDKYPVLQKISKDGAKTVIEIERPCLTETCKSRGIAKGIDLSQFNSTPPCKDAICASEKIFGKTRGIQMLWTYLKYGLSLSPYSSPNADPSGFSDTNMRAMLIALNSTPPHLREVALKDSAFYRFKKGSSLAIYGLTNIIANAAGAVFDGIDDQEFPEQIATFVHEIGHRTSRFKDLNLDTSEKWFAASGWKRGAGNKFVNESTDGWISDYSRTRPGEDFAEAYALYRLDGRQLKRLSPKRYDFLRTEIFDGIEFTENPCAGTVSKSPAGSTSPALKSSRTKN